jgi:hypothetical protein
VASDQAQPRAPRQTLQIQNLQKSDLGPVPTGRVVVRVTQQEMDAALAAVFDHATLGSESKVRMLVHAFMYYFIGHDDAAVHMALPRVEALLREIERGRNVPVLAVAKGPISGGMTQLGGLIDNMPAAGFNEDWTSSVKLLLTDGVRGLNLRNDVSHGLSDCPPRIHVALVLHAALFLLAVVHGVVARPQPPEPTITTSGDDD